MNIKTSADSNAEYETRHRHVVQSTGEHGLYFDHGDVKVSVTLTDSEFTEMFGDNVSTKSQLSDVVETIDQVRDTLSSAAGIIERLRKL